MKRLHLSWPSAVIWLLAALLLLGLPGQVRGQEINQATSAEAVHIFFSGGCADCWPYLEETLLPALETINLAANAEVHDFTRSGGRADLLAMSDAAGLPRSMADSLYAFIPLGDGQLVSMGHVPRSLLQQALSLSEQPAGLVIWQPQMGMQQMEADLFTNFQAAVNEALFVAAAAALVTAVAVSVFVSRRVVTPIRQMMQASQHIAAGHYAERVQATSDDELGQLARSFNQMAVSLQQTEAMRRDLIANVAHELRTPLTTIKGYMEGLLDGVLPPEPDTYQQVYREADRLQRLVSDLQELSRVEAGAYELNRHSLTIIALIRQVVARLRPQFEEKEVNLELELPAEVPTVLADEDRVSQVLLNLIGNALQYTPAGGTVTIAAENHSSELHVIIYDTGLGIPPEHLPHLFARFYRVDKSRSRAGGGSGIGLTIVKHLIEAHGGRVWAESEGAGQGSTFGFSLPVDAIQQIEGNPYKNLTKTSSIIP